ncbi:unnamed protein product [Rhodiola kirilowii]
MRRRRTTSGEAGFRFWGFGDSFLRLFSVLGFSVLGFLISTCRFVSRIEASKSSERRGKGEEILETDDTDDDIMSDEERLEWRRKIREMMDMCPDVQQDLSPYEKQERMQKLLADYSLVVDVEDPEWPEDADGRGFKF